MIMMNNIIISIIIIIFINNNDVPIIIFMVINYYYYNLREFPTDGGSDRPPLLDHAAINRPRLQSLVTPLGLLCMRKRKNGREKFRKVLKVYKVRISPEINGSLRAAEDDGKIRPPSG